MIIDYLTSHLLAGSNYLVAEQNRGEIDQFLLKELYGDEKDSSRHGIWSERARSVSEIGKRIGWVPTNIPLVFFTDNVLEEIATASAVRRNEITARSEDYDIARVLLQHVDLLPLAQRQPHFLSEGETKIVWFLCQWAKAPEYLIVGDLPAAFSENRTAILVDVLIRSDDICNSIKIKSPTFVLGYSPEHANWTVPLQKSTQWVKREEGFFYDV